MNAKILGLIPARYASTRFPGKPLADIGGKPMIQRVYERAASVLEHVYVATDDERIANVVKSFGGRVVMTADTHKSGTDRCAEALNTVQAELNISFHAVINIQGDEPFIEPTQIRLLASAFEDAKTEIATLVKPVDNQADLISPNKPKVVLSQENNALYFSRQPIPYLRGVEIDKWLESGTKYYNHIGMYGYRADVLGKITKLPLGTLEKIESLEQLRWLENGYTIKVLETELESLSIDTPEDLQALKDRGLI
ncbi:MAG: 3-deoxy-manno-octulosonate cytidylyltransferase [Bacteroidia bacterium]|nr:3-deoxy-manno-octulosonate cytidylyltransferase [Bacteroidia bacterium]